MSVPRRLLRWGLRAAGLMLLLALTLALGFTLYAVSALPPLQPWHTELLRNEFSASRHGQFDFAAYRQLEERLFAELQAKTDGWIRDGIDPVCLRIEAVPVDAVDCASQANENLRNSRFNRSGWLHRLVDGAPFNRSFRLEQPQPVAQALLVHGLTDSPYSMHAMARRCMHAASMSRCCAFPATARCLR